MATIKSDYGHGGVPMTPTGVDSQPPLALVLRDIADDIGSRSAIAAPALLAFTDPPSAAEMALLRTLVNEIRTKMLTTVKTVKG